MVIHDERLQNHYIWICRFLKKYLLIKSNVIIESHRECKQILMKARLYVDFIYVRINDCMLFRGNNTDSFEMSSSTILTIPTTFGYTS